MKKQVFCVKKNVQIFCSAGILRWRGEDAGRSQVQNGKARMTDGGVEDLHSWLAPFLQQLQVCGSFTCTGTTAAGPAGSVCSQRHCRHERVSESGSVQNDDPEIPSHTHASVHPHSSPIILCTPCSAGLVTTAKVVSSCPWNDRGDAVEADLQDVAPPAIETPCDAEAGEVGGAKISPSRNSVQKLAEPWLNSAALATIFL